MSNKLNVLKNYLTYKHRKFRTREALEKFQQKRIKEKLDYVSSHSDFYKEFAHKDLKDYPIIDKKIMMDNFNIINTVGIDRDEALELVLEPHIAVGFSW